MNKLIRFDWAVKRLLRNKANFGILEGFLSELLFEDIKIENILESESNKQSFDNKSNRVDLLVRNSKEELIIIEVQSDKMFDYLARMVFGTSKLIVDNIDKGMPYSDIKKVISVNIVYFDLGKGQDYIYHGFTQFRGLHSDDVLQLSQREQQVYRADKIAKIYPEYYIIKADQFNDISLDPLDQWIYFLKNGEIREEFNAKGIKVANEQLSVLKLSKQELAEYEAYINDQRDTQSLIATKYIDGKEDGIQIGEANKEQYANAKAHQKQREIALKCKMDGMSIDKIAEWTSLSIDEINSL